MAASGSYKKQGEPKSDVGNTIELENKISELLISNEAKEKRIEELSEALNNTEKAYEIMRDKSEYWKQRCEAAEWCIEKSPCDPDITEAQIDAHTRWEKLKNKTQ